MIRSLSVCLTVALYAHPLLAAEPTAAEPVKEPHAIEKALSTCMDGTKSTADMIACEDKAFKDWDDELNRVYKELMGKLKPAQKDALKTSQLAWIKHKDHELQWVAALYDGFDGTMYQPMRVDAAKQVIRRRAEELTHYLETYNEHGASASEEK